MRRAWPLVLLVVACHDFDALSGGSGKSDLSAPGDDLAGVEDMSQPLGDLGPLDGPPPDIAASCSDGLLGPGETDVDCGANCLPCDVGRVCAVDMDCQTGYCDLARCALATAPPSWVQLGSVPGNVTTAPIPRVDLVVEQGSDGNLYLMAGLDDSGNLNDVERLDQTALTWSSTNTLQNRRRAPASASNGTAIYLLYGAQSTGFENTVERMTTPSNWNTQTGLAYNVSSAGAAFGNDGKIYLAGGSDGNNPLKNLRAFTPGDNSLTSLKNLTTARERLGVARGADGRVYAAGGYAAGVTLDSVEAYTIAGDTWAAAAAMPEPRASTHAVLGPDGRIYMPGGANLSGGVLYKSVVAYSAPAAPLPDRWSHVAPLLMPRYRHGVGVGVDGRIYVAGGADLATYVRSVEVYGPVITPNPTHKQAGQNINVSGSNFAQNATVRFSLGSAAAAVIGTGTTNAAGVLPSTAVMIPLGTAAGATRLYATDTRSRYPVSALFTVDP